MKVSVIMPNFNKSDFLGAAIESVLGQSYSNFELIAVDDGSTDESKEIIEAYAEKDSRVVSLNHNQNLGVSRAKNDGMRKANGDFFCFLDSDDIYTKDKLELQVSALKSRKDSIAYCDWFSIGKDGAVSRAEHRILEEDGFIFPSLIRRSIIVNAHVMIPRSCFESIGRYFDESLKVCEDYDLLLALSEKFSFVYIPKSLYGYRLYEGNVSSSVNRRWRYARKAEVLRRYIGSPLLSKEQRIAAYENICMCDIASRSYRKMFTEAITHYSYFVGLVRKIRSRNDIES